MDRSNSNSDVSKAIVILGSWLGSSVNKTKAVISLRSDLHQLLKNNIFNPASKREDISQPFVTAAEIAHIVDHISQLKNGWGTFDAKTFTVIGQVLLLSEFCLATEQGLYQMMVTLREKASDTTALSLKKTIGEALLDPILQALCLLEQQNKNSRMRRSATSLLFEIIHNGTDKTNLKRFTSLLKHFSIEISSFFNHESDIVIRLAWAMILCCILRMGASKDIPKSIRSFFSDYDGKQIELVKLLAKEEISSGTWYNIFDQWQASIEMGSSQSQSQSRNILKYSPHALTIGSTSYVHDYETKVVYLWCQGKNLSLFSENLEDETYSLFDCELQNITGVFAQKCKTTPGCDVVHLTISNPAEMDFVYLLNMKAILDPVQIDIVCLQELSNDTTQYLERVFNFPPKGSIPINKPFITSRYKASETQIQRHCAEVTRIAQSDPISSYGSDEQSSNFGLRLVSTATGKENILPKDSSNNASLIERHQSGKTKTTGAQKYAGEFGIVDSESNKSSEDEEVSGDEDDKIYEDDISSPGNRQTLSQAIRNIPTAGPSKPKNATKLSKKMQTKDGKLPEWRKEAKVAPKKTQTKGVTLSIMEKAATGSTKTSIEDTGDIYDFQLSELEETERAIMVKEKAKGKAKAKVARAKDGIQRKAGSTKPNLKAKGNVVHGKTTDALLAQRNKERSPVKGKGKKRQTIGHENEEDEGNEARNTMPAPKKIRTSANIAQPVRRKLPRNAAKQAEKKISKAVKRIYASSQTEDDMSNDEAGSEQTLSKMPVPQEKRTFLTATDQMSLENPIKGQQQRQKLSKAVINASANPKISPVGNTWKLDDALNKHRKVAQKAQTVTSEKDLEPTHIPQSLPPISKNFAYNRCASNLRESNILKYDDGHDLVEDQDMDDDVEGFQDDQDRQTTPPAVKRKHAMLVEKSSPITTSLAYMADENLARKPQIIAFGKDGPPILKVPIPGPIPNIQTLSDHDDGDDPHEEPGPNLDVSQIYHFALSNNSMTGRRSQLEESQVSRRISIDETGSPSWVKGDAIAPFDENTTARNTAKDVTHFKNGLVTIEVSTSPTRESYAERTRHLDDHDMVPRKIAFTPVVKPIIEANTILKDSVASPAVNPVAITVNPQHITQLAPEYKRQTVGLSRAKLDGIHKKSISQATDVENNGQALVRKPGNDQGKLGKLPDFKMPTQTLRRESVTSMAEPVAIVAEKTALQENIIFAFRAPAQAAQVQEATTTVDSMPEEPIPVDKTPFTTVGAVPSLLLEIPVLPANESSHETELQDRAESSEASIVHQLQTSHDRTGPQQMACRPVEHSNEFFDSVMSTSLLNKLSMNQLVNNPVSRSFQKKAPLLGLGKDNVLPSNLEPQAQSVQLIQIRPLVEAPRTEALPQNSSSIPVQNVACAKAIGVAAENVELLLWEHDTDIDKTLVEETSSTIPEDSQDSDKEHIHVGYGSSLRVPFQMDRTQLFDDMIDPSTAILHILEPIMAHQNRLLLGPHDRAQSVLKDYLSRGQEICSNAFDVRERAFDDLKEELDQIKEQQHLAYVKAASDLPQKHFKGSTKSILAVMTVEGKNVNLQIAAAMAKLERK